MDLLFTKEISLEEDIYYECPFRRSDHVFLEIEIKGDIEDKQEEYKKKKKLCKSKLYSNEGVFHWN